MDLKVLELSEQEIVRRQNMQALRDMGIEPYPAAEYPVTAWSTDIISSFVDLPVVGKDEDGNDVRETATPENSPVVSIAGRVMSKRIMGKAGFAELQDSKGRIQVYVQRDSLAAPHSAPEGATAPLSTAANGNEAPSGAVGGASGADFYNIVFKKLLDLGDFIGVKGYVFRTKTGEISVHVMEMTLLSKSLKPLPVVKTDAEGNVYDSFDDPELRYRQRYVDLVVNAGVKETFLKRATIIRTMRRILDEAGYTEVDTPILQNIPGGASARPFMTHFNALNQDMYMRIATELYLKRLIVGGFEGVYEMGKNFRNEGMDKTHNPEFTCMELYVSYKDLNWGMGFTERMLEQICTAVNGKPEVEIDGQVISFKAPFRRLPILEAIQEKTGYDLYPMNEDEIREVAKKLGIEVDETMGKGKLIDEIFGETCEGTFIQPTFITDYPVEMSPLTKMHRSKPGLTERFELMVNGKELANAYSELNDPIDQEQRFIEQMKLADKGDDEAMIIDQDFLRALQYGMPPTFGIGIGIDRLVMLLTGKFAIGEVMLFPQMKPEVKAPRDKDEAFLALGVPQDLIPVLRKAGYNLVATLKGEKPAKIQQQIIEIVKKYKLDLEKPSQDAIAAWTA
ncbi:MAG: lysine--tRNA ligase [Prevotella sp.]|nr:lysine--tRNA ligase [Prevotella sp.]